MGNTKYVYNAPQQCCTNAGKHTEPRKQFREESFAIYSYAYYTRAAFTDRRGTQVFIQRMYINKLVFPCMDTCMRVIHVCSVCGYVGTYSIYTSLNIPYEIKEKVR